MAAAEPSERELAMAHQLVEALSAHFEPDRYHDQYREQLRELIDRKAAGEEIVAEPAAEEPGAVLDLMAALEASLARAGSEEPAKAKAEKPAKKRASRSRKSA
jgi:DNA end-binding protein Ku